MDYKNMESSTGRYIYIKNGYKIINPTHEGRLYKYEGNLDGYDFPNQRKNLDEIQEVLGKIGKKLEYVYVGKFMGEKRMKTIFLARDSEGNIWWRKHEGRSDGSGENVIYEYGKKYRLSVWLKMRK